MSNGFALWKDDVRDLDSARISLSASGVFSLSTQEQVAQVQLDPANVPYVDVYVAGDWLCAVGGSDDTLVVGRLTPTVHLGVAGTVTRIDGRDRFEFERHSVRFHDRPDHDQCVLAWEIGIALVDRAEGLVWTYVHGDVNHRLVKITPSTVELRGLYESVTVQLADGHVEVDEFRVRPADENPEVLAEWMRGIGR